MSASAELSEKAQRSISQVWQYVHEKDGTQKADRLVVAIRKAIFRVAENPQLGHFRYDLTDRPVKFYRVYKYLIIYDPARSPIYILHVFHSAQDITSHLEEVE